MEKLHLEVITPEKVIVNEDVESVVATGSLGCFWNTYLFSQGLYQANFDTLQAIKQNLSP